MGKRQSFRIPTKYTGACYKPYNTVAIYYIIYYSDNFPKGMSIFKHKSHLGYLLIISFIGVVKIKNLRFIFIFLKTL